MANYKTEAIVLKSINFSETDKILTIFTKDRGKLSVIAKGARKIKSRKGPFLDLLNYNQFSLAEGKSLDVVTDVKSLNSFSEMKESLKDISALYYLTELVDKLIEENQQNKEVFKILISVLEALKAAESVEKQESLLRSFELRLLDRLGFSPELQECVKCRSELVPEGNVFSSQEGGIVCSKCKNSGAEVSAEAIKVLRFFSANPFPKVQRLVPTKKVRGEVEEILASYLEHVLERRLNSRKFRDEVNGED